MAASPNEEAESIALREVFARPANRVVSASTCYQLSTASKGYSGSRESLAGIRAMPQSAIPS